MKSPASLPVVRNSGEIGMKRLLNLRPVEVCMHISINARINIHCLCLHQQIPKILTLYIGINELCMCNRILSYPSFASVGASWSIDIINVESSSVSLRFKNSHQTLSRHASIAVPVWKITVSQNPSQSLVRNEGMALVKLVHPFCVCLVVNHRVSNLHQSLYILLLIFLTFYLF